MTRPIASLLDIPGKDSGLSVLGEKPFVAETPEELLDDETTPIARFFVRNNGLTPPQSLDPDAWTFALDGEVNTPLQLTVGELKARFAHKTLRMVLECGGNGRAFFDPPAKGNPWTNGGVGCAEWTGVALADVLEAAGLKPSAVYTAHYGADPHVTEPGAVPISRGVPLAKALEPHTLLAFAMNGEPLPFIHGGPLRLVVPGWPGSLSHKWLTRIWIRDREHDGPGMTGQSYRLPAQAIEPGTSGEGIPFHILESMPVRSIITAPADGTRLPEGAGSVFVRGAAWAGDSHVTRVELSVDGGATWQAAELAPQRNRYDWVRFTADLALVRSGPVEIMVRATDDRGRAQPLKADNWNPQGYACNEVHRVRISVG
ncbi:MAG TPA: sulfite oxidase [Microvirga sp.]|jgi:DMSO/TMAO reductase YedYZ molybdopterin-dependent catalytic subunit|nr:sulfite oxidase [Microvirga sp.]